MSLGSWYCILTNATAILPSIMLYKRNMIADCFMCAWTGLASLLYHFDRLEYSFMNPVSIRNTDIIMANLLVFHTTNILCLKRSARKWSFTVFVLPMVIYTADVDLMIRVGIMISYGIIGVIYAIIHRKKEELKWIAGGCLLIFAELCFFIFGNKNSYAWLHGSHHIAAFLSMASFIKTVPYKNAIELPI